MNFLCCLIGVIVSFACFGQRKTDSVIVLPVKMAVPYGAKKLGAIKVGDNAFKVNCDYEKIIDEAKEKAMRMGGNIVKITALIPPAFVSKCYRVRADVYYLNTPEYKKENTGGFSTSVPNVNYAVLYIYRLKDTVAPTPFYKLHLNGDSTLCTVKSRWKEAVNIYKEGPATLWAKTEKREELKLDVKMGEAYYIRCGVRGSQFWLTPVIELVDKTTGAEEYKKLRRGKKDMDVQYLGQIH